MTAAIRSENLEDLDQFRGEVRQWLETHCPQSQRQPMTPQEQYWGGRRGSFPSEDARLWFERMRDRGWTVPEWPKEYGGAGLSPQQGKILKEEMKRIKARTPLYGIGIWMLGPALLEYGNEAQKEQHIRAIVNGEARWAQGYSEPGSGSDLASLQCRAEDMGDHFLINGSKIWTTAADHCDWIFCLVRTDPDAKKQQGISFLLIDMDDPGISTTPIELISGESEFCQTFFDNVKVPRENLVGELNKGWDVAKALLVHERKLMSEMGSDSPREMSHFRGKNCRGAQFRSPDHEVCGHGGGEDQERTAVGYHGQSGSGLAGRGLQQSGDRHPAPVGHVQSHDHRRRHLGNPVERYRQK
jgi:acyl-CoA dehydrogenase